METIDGFTYISNRIKEFYPEQEGLYYGTLIPGYLGGKDPLDGVEIWESDKGCPHWLYVTYGFTDLYIDEDDDIAEHPNHTKQVNKTETNDSQISGYGFELTFRLKRGAEDAPPVWPAHMLQNLARYVFSTGNAFDSGHHIKGNGPLALGSNTQLTSIGFLTDPELGRIQTANGSMVFLEAVAITEDELESMMCWSVESFLKELIKHIPYGIADLSRTTLMNLPDFRSAWEQGVERDGSSTAILSLPEADISIKNDKGYLKLGAGHISQLLILLKARIGKGRTLDLQSGDTIICFENAEQTAIYMDNEAFFISLTEEALNEICQLLKPHIGIYYMKTMPLTIELIPTDILDNDGNIVQTIE